MRRLRSEPLRRNLCAMGPAHEPCACGEEDLAHASTPRLERCTVCIAKRAQDGDRLEERFALAAANREGWVASAQWFPALGAIIGRERCDLFAPQNVPALLL